MMASEVAQGHFLRHHADVDRIAPQIAKSVKSEAIVEPANQTNVTFEPNIGSDKNRGIRITSVGIITPTRIASS